MAKKLKGVDGLADEVKKILEEYKEDVTVGVAEAVEKASKAGAKAVKQEAQKSFRGTGAYAKGWKAKIEKGRLTTTGTIYNKDLPGLPHLLEHGHANRGGGRTPGTVHIKPAENMIEKDFMKAIKEAV